MGDQSGFTYRTTGSIFLQPVSNFVGIPLEQVNFLGCQVFALAAAFWFRLYLSPQHASTVVRHAIVTLLGISFLIFCFGWYSVHIFILVFACYWIMLKSSIHNIHRPLMIIAQKTTCLAFQLHDGMSRKADDLTAEQRRLAVRSKPSLLEYLSYHLNFLSVLVGPCSNYKDYMEFIAGRHIQSKLKESGYSGPEPSPVGAVIHKLLICAICLFLFMTVTKTFPITYNTDVEFISHASFLTRLAYSFFSIQAARPKFYFAWTFADAINNAAGYGLRTVDRNGQASWDLVSNLNIWDIETATSFKMFIDNWNIQTGLWLKRVCYDRAPRYRTALTFVLSALWHGVYPGYYFTFLTAIPITFAARTVRKSFRQHFLSSAVMQFSYDVLTWLATQLAICYTVMPFLLLAVEPTMQYYRSMYFHFHIMSVLAAVILPLKSTHPYQANHSNNNLQGK
ncbi:lysophospholipid acyltransferase 1 isoform X2 [Conger conger]|uniref:lysophospholipid acyltransferase 1 isoform X2 n=1 Tax=Conger conger TaxID=82655 RepID=UPI002A5A4399|nr:lysophospholipid acyltransferase 1 isoform X2 [Conger conger]